MKLCTVSEEKEKKNGCGCGSSNNGMPDINISIQNNSSADTGQRSMTSPNYAPNYMSYYAPNTNTALRNMPLTMMDFPQVASNPGPSSIIERVPIIQPAIVQPLPPRTQLQPTQSFVAPPTPQTVTVEAPAVEETCKRTFVPLALEWY
jgi:hypothetical protein